MFQVIVHDVSVSFATTPLLRRDRPQLTFDYDFTFKSYKIIKDKDGSCSMIGYFDTYENLKKALKTQFSVDKTFYQWCKYKALSTKKRSTFVDSSRSSPKKSPRNESHKTKRRQQEKSTSGNKTSSKLKKDRFKNKKKKSDDSVAVLLELLFAKLR